jgi:hypothetical protein
VLKNPTEEVAENTQKTKKLLALSAKKKRSSY